MRAPNLISIYKSITDTLFTYLKYFNILCNSENIPSQKTKKHLVILAWAFPPEVTGGVYRPMSIARAAKARGWRVSVVCGFLTEQASLAGSHLANKINDSGRIIRINKSTRNPSYKLFYPKISGGVINILETIDLSKDIFLNDQPSVILASGPPFHNFVVARNLSKLFKKPYVLDYRDEWTECPFDFVGLGNIDLFYEKKCIENANRIIFTTKSHLEHQRKVFNILDESKLTLIPNGWDSEEKIIETAINPLEPAEFRLAFLGHLGEHTLPNQLLNPLQIAFDKSPEYIDKLRISFVGTKSKTAINQLRKFKYKNVIEEIDAVPKPIALRIMMDATGLILINEPRLHRYRPGKLYDYIAMRTPILVYGAGGEIEDVVKLLNIGIILYENETIELPNLILRLREIRNNCRSSSVDSWLAEHTRQKSADAIINLIDNIENSNA